MSVSSAKLIEKEIWGQTAQSIICFQRKNLNEGSIQNILKASFFYLPLDSPDWWDYSTTNASLPDFLQKNEVVLHPDQIHQYCFVEEKDQDRFLYYLDWEQDIDIVEQIQPWSLKKKQTIRFEESDQILQSICLFRVNIHSYFVLIKTDKIWCLVIPSVHKCSFFQYLISQHSILSELKTHPGSVCFCTSSKMEILSLLKKIPFVRNEHALLTPQLIQK